jgi:hypothetical protein
MVVLVLLILAAAAAGAVIWGIDRNRHAYGVLFPAAVAIVTVVLLWLVLMAFGLGSEPGIHFLSWLLPLVLCVPAAALAARIAGLRRMEADRHRLEESLRL